MNNLSNKNLAEYLHLLEELKEYRDQDSLLSSGFVPEDIDQMLSDVNDDRSRMAIIRSRISKINYKKAFPSKKEEEKSESSDHRPKYNRGRVRGRFRRVDNLGHDDLRRLVYLKNKLLLSNQSLNGAWRIVMEAEIAAIEKRIEETKAMGESKIKDIIA